MRGEQRRCETEHTRPVTNTQSRQYSSELASVHFITSPERGEGVNLIGQFNSKMVIGFRREDGTGLCAAYAYDFSMDVDSLSIESIYFRDVDRAYSSII